MPPFFTDQDLTNILTNKRLCKEYIKSGYICVRKKKKPHKTYVFSRFYAAFFGGEREIRTLYKTECLSRFFEKLTTF